MSVGRNLSKTKEKQLENLEEEKLNAEILENGILEEDAIATVMEVCNEDKISDKFLAKYTFKLALPAILEMVMQTLLGFADMAMVGSLGAVAISAIGLSENPTNTALGVFAAISVGATAMVARAIGANKKEEAGEIAKQSLMISFVMAAVFTIFALIFAENIMKLMGAEKDVIASGTSYFRITNLSLPMMIITLIMSGVLRGVGDTKTPMYINGGANILNIIGNFFLIFESRTLDVTLPLINKDMSIFIPGAGLGVTGAAISTAIARVLAGMLILYFIFNSKSIIKVNLKEKLRFNGNIIRRMLKIGIPAAIEQFLMRFGMLLFTTIISSLGTVVYAAHKVASTVESLSYNAGFGFALAATTLVGQYLGSKDSDTAERSGFMAVNMGIIFMTVMGVVLFLFPEPLLKIFTRDPQLIEQGKICLKIVAVSQPFLAASMGFSGALRGAGDTRHVLIVTFLGVWAVRLTLTYIFVKVFGLGLIGAWLVMGIDVAFRALLLFIRFKKGTWKKIEI